jgi:hypothetical protein
VPLFSIFSMIPKLYKNIPDETKIPANCVTTNTR